ncbi:MAG: leucine-rich repeat domain-containing protein [Bacteroidales bacterium]|nr:leucine-rich repeat domain-containing protein [Lentimicrobiaceae bacterium]MDD5696159.1 leucine-rich repeat domain-containing protein [Bacteroidales bacterium]
MSKMILPSLSVLTFAFFILIVSATAQVSSHGKESSQELESYILQVRQMVHFIESTFNTLGDPAVTIREKDIIINESYLKFFRDEKVQIEDDLDENRKVVTNKNVQAYLKDINFFFRQVVFTLTIEEISQEVNEDGQIYFKVSLNRNLRGQTIDDSLVNNTQVRYIEINLDPDRKDLKIVSIYTTGLSENEDMANWWQQLPMEWKEFFASQVQQPLSTPLQHILSFGDSTVVLQPDPSDPLRDTLSMNTTSLYESIRQIWSLEKINISSNGSIRNLEPLKKLTRLKSLSMAHTGIDDLTPLRSLSKLEQLDCSHTSVNSLESLRYSLNMSELTIEDTHIEAIGTIENFKKLRVFNMSGTPVPSLESLSGLKELTELRFSNTMIDQLDPLINLSHLTVLDLSGTRVTSLQPVGGMTKLTYLNFGNTLIQDLEPVRNLTALQFLYLDYTPVDNLDPLLSLPDLKRVYCDHSRVTGEKANLFMISKPETLVIYETGELTRWWNSLEAKWKDIFTEQIGIESEPTTEDLHQITLIHKLNLQGDSLITGLDPLTVLINLDDLDISATPVRDLSPLQKSIHLRTLRLAGTQVESLEPLRSLHMIERLDLSGTRVTDLDPLTPSENLSALNIEDTEIASLQSLSGIRNLKLIWADQTQLTQQEVFTFIDQNPACQVIYMTPLLQQWWNSLPEEWKTIFLDALDLTDPPGKEDLHRMMNLEDLSIENNMDIQDLEPLRMLKRLKSLVIRESRITDLMPIKDASRLEKLTCSKSPLAGLSYIASLTSLRYLDISDTQVSDYTLAALLTQLEYLNISGTPAKNLKWVSNLEKLAQFDFYNTSVGSLNELTGLDSLKVIRCYNTKLNDKKIEKFRSLRPDVEVVFY